jgi:hypothetical protein
MSGLSEDCNTNAIVCNQNANECNHTTTWTRKKPTEPGKYQTRVDVKSKIYEVTVTRRGRGLSVYCLAFNDRVPMSDIGERELEWKKA